MIGYKLKVTVTLTLTVTVTPLSFTISGGAAPTQWTRNPDIWNDNLDQKLKPTKNHDISIRHCIRHWFVIIRHCSPYKATPLAEGEWNRRPIRVNLMFEWLELTSNPRKRLVTMLHFFPYWMTTSYPGLLGDCVAISPGKNRNRNPKNPVVFSANQLSLQKSCSRIQDITTRPVVKVWIFLLNLQNFIVCFNVYLLL